MISQHSRHLKPQKPYKTNDFSTFSLSQTPETLQNKQFGHTLWRSTSFKFQNLLLAKVFIAVFEILIENAKFFNENRSVTAPARPSFLNENNRIDLPTPHIQQKSRFRAQGVAKIKNLILLLRGARFFFCLPFAQRGVDIFQFLMTSLR